MGLIEIVARMLLIGKLTRYLILISNRFGDGKTKSRMSSAVHFM